MGGVIYGHPCVQSEVGKPGRAVALAAGWQGLQVLHPRRGHRIAGQLLQLSFAQTAWKALLLLQSCKLLLTLQSPIQPFLDALGRAGIPCWSFLCGTGHRL
jgi:hypothetical protein